MEASADLDRRDDQSLFSARLRNVISLRGSGDGWVLEMKITALISLGRGLSESLLFAAMMPLLCPCLGNIGLSLILL